MIIPINTSHSQTYRELNNMNIPTDTSHSQTYRELNNMNIPTDTSHWQTYRELNNMNIPINTSHSDIQEVKQYEHPHWYSTHPHWHITLTDVQGGKRYEQNNEYPQRYITLTDYPHWYITLTDIQWVKWYEEKKQITPTDTSHSLTYRELNDMNEKNEHPY